MIAADRDTEADCLLVLKYITNNLIYDGTTFTNDKTRAPFCNDQFMTDQILELIDWTEDDEASEFERETYAWALYTEMLPEYIQQNKITVCSIANAMKNVRFP